MVTQHIRICNADKWVGKRRVSIWFSSIEEERGRRKQRAETLCFAGYLYGLARPVTRSCLPTPVTRDLAPFQQVTGIASEQAIPCSRPSVIVTRQARPPVGEFLHIPRCGTRLYSHKYLIKQKNYNLNKNIQELSKNLIGYKQIL